MPERAVLHMGYRFKDRRMILLCRVMDAVLAFLGIKQRPLPEPVGKVLLMKPDHLGDMLMLTAVLPLLKERFPQAAVDILCGSWSLAVLENNPLVRNRIVLDHPAYNRGKVSLLRKSLVFLRTLVHAAGTLRRERYDLCLNFRDAGGDLILLARLCGCRHIIGHVTGGFGPLLDTVARWEEGKHEIEHYLEVLAPLSIRASIGDIGCLLYPSPSDEERLSAIIGKYRLEPFVVLHPGSGDPRKLLPALAWARLVEAQDEGVRVVFTGTGDERRIFDEVTRLVQRSLVGLMGELSIPQLYALFRRARRVYTLDSMAGHLGGMSGTHTVIFWSPTNDPNQWRPLGGNVELDFSQYPTSAAGNKE